MSWLNEFLGLGPRSRIRYGGDGGGGGGGDNVSGPPPPDPNDAWSYGDFAGGWNPTDPNQNPHADTSNGNNGDRKASDPNDASAFGDFAGGWDPTDPDQNPEHPANDASSYGDFAGGWNPTDPNQNVNHPANDAWSYGDFAYGWDPTDPNQNPAHPGLNDAWSYGDFANGWNPTDPAQNPNHPDWESEWSAEYGISVKTPETPVEDLFSINVPGLTVQVVANTAVSLPDLTDIKSIERATFGIKVDFEGVLSYEGTITVEDGRVVSFEVAGDLNVRGFMAGVTMEQTDSGFNGAVSFGFGVQNQAKTNKAKVTATISFDERGLHSLSMGLAAAANTRNDFLGNAHISAEAGIELNGRTEENAISINTEIGSDLTGHHSIQANYVGEVQDLTYVNSDPEQGLLLGSPIMLDLNRDGRVDLVDLAESSASFDLDGDGFRENVSWVGPDDGFLVADLNNDGRITFAAELAISEQTAAPDSDMEALSSVYDADGNGLVDAADDGFEKLRVWQDKDQDGEVDEGELRTLAQAGIQSIDVDSGAGGEWTRVCTQLQDSPEGDDVIQASGVKGGLNGKGTVLVER